MAKNTTAKTSVKVFDRTLLVKQHRQPKGTTPKEENCRGYINGWVLVQFSQKRREEEEEEEESG